MLLEVVTTNTSDSWSDIHVSSDPKSRAETPLSVTPLEAAPASAFSTSSAKRMQGAMASAIRNADRMFCSV